MLAWNLDEHARLHVLCLGAHSDDIEIGCGGALLRLMGRCAHLRVDWVVFSGDARRQAEARESATSFLGDTPHTLHFGAFRDGFFPYDGGAVKEFMESLKEAGDPDLIFTHHRDDLHQDHRLLCELTGNTWRDHAVLEYEIPKYDGDLGRPNAFVALEPELVERKITHLLQHFGSQRSKQWFDAETFRGLLRLRGVECASPTGYAEAFHAPKLRLLG